MRDTVWNGEVQKMVDENGTPKGMRNILQERGVDTTGMRVKDMRHILILDNRRQYLRIT